jgi:serine/threonine protein kinase
MNQAPPSRIDRYEIVGELGRGMMGVVYEARDPLLGRRVALKTIRVAVGMEEQYREEFEKRFYAEARAAATLSHPGIVLVYDVGTDPNTGELFLALEYLEGRSLDAVLRAGKVAWRDALRLMGQVAEALHHAHSQGVIHRDVKPANIMILASGQPKLMDFGIAKIQGSALTTGGRFFGTPSYMSPERAGGNPVDATGDVFSLGAVLFEVVTGQQAFSGPDIASIMTRVVYNDPPAPTTLVPGLPPELDRVVARCLAKNPAQRYPNGRSLAEDLEDLLAGRRPRHAAEWGSARPSPEAGVSGSVAQAPIQAPKGDDTARRGSAGATRAFPPGKRVSLAILSGPRQGDIFLLSRPQALIGREGGHAGADLELPDAEASRAHAMLECYGSRIVVLDLGSTNGTFVGEERITEHALEDHGEFRIGRTGIMLILADQD